MEYIREYNEFSDVDIFDNVVNYFDRSNEWWEEVLGSMIKNYFADNKELYNLGDHIKADRDTYIDIKFTCGPIVYYPYDKEHNIVFIFMLFRSGPESSLKMSAEYEDSYYDYGNKELYNYTESEYPIEYDIETFADLLETIETYFNSIKNEIDMK